MFFSRPDVHNDQNYYVKPGTWSLLQELILMFSVVTESWSPVSARTTL